MKLYQDTADKISLLYIDIESKRHQINSPFDFKEYIGTSLPIKSFISTRDLFLIKESTDIVIDSVQQKFEEGSKLLSDIKAGKITKDTSIIDGFGNFAKKLLDIMYSKCVINLVKYEDTTEPHLNTRPSIYYLWVLDLGPDENLNMKSRQFILNSGSSESDFYFKLDEYNIASLCEVVHNEYPNFSYIRESIKRDIQLQDISYTKITNTVNIHSKTIYYDAKNIRDSVFSI